MNELEQLLSDLVSINSINPELVESVSGRPNVVGIARGTGGGKTLLLNGHMDTVGVAGMSGGHQPRIDREHGRLYGRGGYDMKGGLAACMLATAEAQKQ